MCWARKALGENPLPILPESSLLNPNLLTQDLPMPNPPSAMFNKR